MYCARAGQLPDREHRRPQMVGQTSNSGREAVEPLTPWSMKIRCRPALLQRIDLKLGVWSVVLTRAYPITAIASPVSISRNSPGLRLLVMRRVSRSADRVIGGRTGMTVAGGESQSHQPIVFETGKSRGSGDSVLAGCTSLVGRRRWSRRCSIPETAVQPCSGLVDLVEGVVRYGGRWSLAAPARASVS